METRKRISEVLEEIGRLNPSVRFGQLVANISFIARGPVRPAVWDVEDGEFLKAALSYLENLRRVDPASLAALAGGAEVAPGADVDRDVDRTDRR